MAVGRLFDAKAEVFAKRVNISRTHSNNQFSSAGEGKRLTAHISLCKLMLSILDVMCQLKLQKGERENRRRKE